MNYTSLGGGMSGTGWIVDWLTAGRFRKYLRAAGGDRDQALLIYDWNARLAAAFLHDLAHLEVGVRNTYDRVLSIHPVLRGRDWLTEAGARQLFRTHYVVEDGRRRDKNRTPRSRITEARRRSGCDRGAPRGKAVAELTFGFWSYLTDDLHEKTLWVPALHKAYRPGTSRTRVNAAMAKLRDLRNRAAHHESVFDRDPEGSRRRIVYVAGLLSPQLKSFIDRTSDLPSVISQKP